MSEVSNFSVGELLRNRMGEDRWNLALVQRDEVWDVDRMRRLLDSLLAGYPIGALLLCRTAKAASKVIKRSGGESTVTDVDPLAWQLLDGQQRINALYTMLTASDSDHERYGRFYLDLTVQRPAPSPEAGHSDKHLTHLVWRNPLDGTAPDDFEGRARCIDLSRVYAWAERGGIDRAEHLLGGAVAEVAVAIDPEFKHALSTQETAIATDWMQRLIRVWREPTVPVMRAEVNAPEDVLELFARLNRSGIPFRDVDIYFAAVKTFWTEAEPSLHRVLKATTYVAPNGTRVPLLTMEGALRLVSRLAARGIGRGDVIPLRVSGIAGSRREAMVAAMTVLTAKDSAVIDRLGKFTRTFCSQSRLGYAIRLVKGQLWDEVLTWAVVRGTWRADDLRTIDDYLFGGTLFAYPTIFRSSYSAIALVEAASAGTRDEGFPLAPILGSTRDKYPNLERSRRRVAALSPPDDADDRARLRLANENQSLLLALGQRIPVDHQAPLDVDHIYPSALASRMRGNTPRSHHPDRWRVNSLGNKWYLDASANRSLQAMAPHPKFEQLMSWLAGGDADRLVWERGNWAIEDDEIEKFALVDRELGEDIDRAMRVFSELTANRTARLLENAMEEFPGARQFARDAAFAEPNEPAELTAEVLQTLRERLGLADLQVPELARPPSADVSVTLGGWEGRAAELVWAFKKATRDQHFVGNDRAKRANRTQTEDGAQRHGFDYVRWVWIGSPAHGTHVGVGAVTDPDQARETPLWLLLSSETAGYSLARDLLQRSAHSPLPEDGRGVWFPIPLDPDRQWGELSKQIYDRMQEVRNVLEAGVAN